MRKPKEATRRIESPPVPLRALFLSAPIRPLWENFTERRLNLTQISFNPSRRGRTIGQPSRILAIAASNRYVGAVLLIGDEPSTPRCARIRCGGAYRQNQARLASWTRQLLVHAPALVAITCSSRARGLPDAVSTEIDSARVPVAEVCRDDICRILGLRSVTCAAIRRSVSAKFPCVAVRMQRALDVRSEAERYWEMPAVALAAGIAARRMLAGKSPDQQP